MATVNVTTFSEFRTAAEQYGNTIICPNNAVWDISEIDPENTITTITIRSIVTGNNTEIKNFRGRIECGSSITITALHIINLLCESGSYGGAISTESRNVNPNVWQQSRISAAIGANVDYLLYNICPIRCAINVSMAKSGECILSAFYSDSTAECKYNRILLSAPNASIVGWNKINSSQFIVNAPIATRFAAVPLNCTIRGNLSNVSSFQYSSSATNFSVVNGTDAPDFPTATWMKKVTDAQMRDADYLASIGFVIGTE